MTLPGLKSGPFGLESNTLTIRPLYFPLKLGPRFMYTYISVLSLLFKLNVQREREREREGEVGGEVKEGPTFMYTYIPVLSDLLLILLFKAGC